LAEPTKPRVYLVIDKGMIWEAYSDAPVELILKNVDKQWIRHLKTVINNSEIENILKLVSDLEEYQVKMPGLAEEEIKHIKVKKPKAPLKRSSS
jgi:hypothetical protein